MTHSYISFTGRVFVGELSIAMKIIQAKESGGLWASSPLYFRLRTFKITLTILSLDLRIWSVFAPSKALVMRGFLIERVPVLLCLWGEPVRAVHMEVSTPGFWSQPRLVSSLSAGSVSAVALA